MKADRLVGRMWDFLERALARFGPRESCSPAEQELGQWLMRRWAPLGWVVRAEPFRCRPHAFLGFIPFTALFYFLAVAAFWVAPVVTVVLGVAILLVTYLELVRYREFIDFLFPERVGENILATLTPRGPIRQRVLISAHRDSAYEFHLWYWFKNAAVPLMVIAFLAPAVPAIGAVGRVLWAPADDSMWVLFFGYTSLALVPFVALNLVFHTYRTVPGAMDDLAGVAVLDGLAAWLAAEHKRDQGLEHTEVWLLATSAEEAGLRGAKRFAATHREELRSVPTFGIFIDGVCDERHLTVVYAEWSTGVRHARRLVFLAFDILAEYGWRYKTGPIRLGATDASAFAKCGIETVALLCQDIEQLVPNYHTRLDTLDRVRPRALRNMLELTYRMIRELDKKAGTHTASA